MIKKLMNYMLDVRDRQRMSIALSKGMAMRQARNIELEKPSTWEFSGFSQNGEDGIIDVLRRQLLSCNRYFIEIGASDGMQNNSSWLVVAEQYDGLMIDGDPRRVERAQRMIAYHSIGVECMSMFVDSENIKNLRAKTLYADPDVFSLDIDGVDYYIAKALLSAGFKPKIFVVEYNSVYGPVQSMTIPYQDNFVFTKAHTTQLYYGVSISAWKKLFNEFGYRFITVDRKGVNGFFVNPLCFNSDFLNSIVGSDFVENIYQYTKFKGDFEKQFQLISNQEFSYI